MEDTKYEVTITTTSTVSVYADSATEAKQLGEEMYKSGDACASLGEVQFSAELDDEFDEDDYDGPEIGSIQTLEGMDEFSPDDFGLSEDEHEDLNGCKVIINNIVGDGTYFDVVVVDSEIEILGLCEYHMGFK